MPSQPIFPSSFLDPFEDAPAGVPALLRVLDRGGLAGKVLSALEPTGAGRGCLGGLYRAERPRGEVALVSIVWLDDPQSYDFIEKYFCGKLEEMAENLASPRPVCPPRISIQHKIVIIDITVIERSGMARLGKESGRGKQIPNRRSVGDSQQNWIYLPHLCVSTRRKILPSLPRRDTRPLRLRTAPVPASG